LRSEHDGELDLSGDVVTVEGDVLANTRRSQYHWPAKGLGLAFGEPRYVVKIDADAGAAWRLAPASNLARAIVHRSRRHW